MFDHKKWFRWPLAVMIIVSIYTLTACKSSDNKVTATDSKSASKTAVVTTPLATQAPTSRALYSRGRHHYQEWIAIPGGESRRWCRLRKLATLLK